MGSSKVRLAVARAIAGSMSLSWSAAHAATLPVPCLGGACAVPFVGQGSASAVQVGPKLTVNQSSGNVTLNWQSFNISKDGAVQFVQPSQSSVALNRIFDANPSQIFGSLNANGRIYLINQNGILFGSGAQVNVGSLVASTLDTNIDSKYNYALLGPTNAKDGNPAFKQFTDASGNPLQSGSITVQQGANLSTPEGGQILVFAPQISNSGTISTPGGQTVLAAGNSVYLASESDANLRGLLVEVAADSAANSTVTNGDRTANSAVTDPGQLVGQIVAQRGNVTLAGLAVNQFGRVSATTSVNENGSIRLQAYQGTIQQNQTTGTQGAGGTLTLGPRSVTDVTLDTADASTTVDSVAQPKSSIGLFGSTIDILDSSTVRATSGSITAQANANGVSPAGGQEDGSRLYIAPGANLDVSGASITLPVSSNVVSAQLRGTELADSPLQQNGPLRSQTVYVDARAHGKNADGSQWQGTPLANLSGELAAVQRNVSERNLTGGTLTLQSGGDVIVASGAQLNVSGGEIQYTSGTVTTTTLLATNGTSVPIASANPNQFYLGTLNQFKLSDPKWNTSNSYTGLSGTYQPGYVQGADGGTLDVSAPRFILDGSINAQVVTGALQRTPTFSARTTDPATGNLLFQGYGGQYQLYRNYDEQPLGATLNIGLPGSAGSDLGAGNVTVQQGAVLAGLHNADGSAFDPLSAQPLPADFTTSFISPGLLGSSGFARVSIAANGKVLLPADLALKFPAGGSLALEGGAVDIEGSVDIPGGSISASAIVTVTTGTDVALTLGPTAALTARGEWVNDNPLLYGGQANTAPLYINGGSISLSSQGNANSSSLLTLAQGSLIDVSGGAQLTQSAALVAGHGGSITLKSLPQYNWNTQNPLEPAHIDFGATLRGYGLTTGGVLNISAGAVCIAAADCSGADANTLWLSPAQFSSGGFSAYNITADQGSLSVAPGTMLALQQQNSQLPGKFGLLPNAPVLPTTGAALLPDFVRQPVSLSLTQVAPANAQDMLGAPLLKVGLDTPSLTIGEGSAITTDPGSSAAISLASNTRIIIDGQISAPGGQISATLYPIGAAQENTYAPPQGIWLGSHGVLSARGAPQIQVLDSGLRTGTVLDGGKVSITAQRGYIELSPGSQIDVSGSSGTVDVQSLYAPVRSEQVASAGGSITLSAAEGLVAGGELNAAAGPVSSSSPHPAGGSLTVALNGSSLFATTGSGVPAGFSNQIIVTSSLAPIVVFPGSAIPDSLAGQAFVGADSINDSGFGSVTLRVRPFQVTSQLQGEINFDGNVNLVAPVRLTLDAANIGVSPGADVQMQAPYVEIGSSFNYGLALPALQSGTGTLSATGQFLELFGTTSLQGIQSATFESANDLRLLGNQNQTSAITGGLYSAGDITLAASQVYPATLTHFVIGTDPSTGTITVQGTPGAEQDLLSASGSLTLRADTIKQDGVLRAPFGTLDLEANTIDLAAGSITSTSANGLTIPFGTTEGGLNWVYPTPNGLSIVYGSSSTTAAPPAQRVILNGANVALEHGATVDVSGGGDLQAYEWIPGVGGTKDVLSAKQRPGQFAIVPGLQANVTPWDPSISSAESAAGVNLNPGDAVYLSGAPGLPAGTYQLLPARYALLPGAYLVTQVPGYQDIRPGTTYSVLGGGTIVAGYRTVAGTSFGDSRTSGFDVVSAALLLGQVQGVPGQAQYTTTGANQFFSAQAALASAAVPLLPRDSGTLELLASATLSLDASLRTQAGKGGLGAAVDISSSQIVVAADSSTPASAGQLLLTTSSLDQLGAQSLLLGGQRSEGTIATQASSVTVESGATLTAPEVLLTASDTVTVSGGAAITASGVAAATRSYALQGDGAFLSVAAGPQATVTRTGSTGSSGVLNLAANSTLTANNGSVYLDATQNVVTSGGIAAAGGDFALQSTHISIGTPTGAVSGTVLAPDLLSGGSLRNALLSSDSTVDFYGSPALSVQNLTIQAQGLAGFGAASDTASLNVSKLLQLSGTGTPGSIGVGTGTGSLSLNAGDIELGAGVVNVSGFNSTMLAAQRALTSTATGGGLASTGDLTVSASEITAKAGVSSSLSATGAVLLTAPSQPTQLAAVTSLGSSLAVTGASVELGTSIVLPSGAVTFTANGTSTATGNTPGDIVLDSGGSISVAGLTRQYDGVNVATPGGRVSLWATGNVNAQSGSIIDVSAAGAGAGGMLTVSATSGAAKEGAVSLNGSLKGGGSGTNGSSISVDGQTFDFAAINQALGTDFAAGRSFRLRGVGDLLVSSGSAITAHDVMFEADQGSIIVNGTLDASGSAGGSVLLAASQDVNVAGTINAAATMAGGRGGRVDLETTGGSMLLQSGSQIDVSGAGPDLNGNAGASGSVLMRVPAATVTAAAAGSAGAGSTVMLAGTIKGAGTTTLEAFRTYDRSGTGIISATDIAADPVNNPIFIAATTDMAAAAPLAANLPASWHFVLAPGVEIDNATGNLELDTPWNLYGGLDPVSGALSGWRFGSAATPGMLTVRAAGTITFNASLSDGFADPTTFTLPATPSSSWSYRIAAGADFTAANPLAVATFAAGSAAQSGANLVVAACQASCTPGASGGRGGGGIYTPNSIRTGDGFIDLAASGNFLLGVDQLGNTTSGSAAALVYTAGVSGPGLPIPFPNGGRTGSGAQLAYPINGGDINISVGGNVLGAAMNGSAPNPDTGTGGDLIGAANQFVNAWLFRVAPNGKAGSPAAWSVNFADFQQGVGALGGGNVTVNAGGDVSEFSASIPSIGAPVGSTLAGSETQVTGGGLLTVNAGGSIIGGSYYAGLGSIALKAGSDIAGPVFADGSTGLAPLIGLGQASVSASARNNVEVSDIITPTLLNLGKYQAGGLQDYYSSYGANSSATLVAAGGNIALNDSNVVLSTTLGSSFANGLAPAQSNGYEDLEGNSIVLDVLPPTLNAYALSGNITVARTVELAPSQNGNLQLFADHSVLLSRDGPFGSQLIVPDAGLGLFPTASAPFAAAESLSPYTDALQALYAPPAVDVYAGTPLHAADAQPVRVVAQGSDMMFDASALDASGIWSGKPVEIIAGRDIVNLNLIGQNLRPSDVTSISAGRDLAYPQSYLANGSVLPNNSQITVGGPGSVALAAGRDINLGTSAGVTTNANLLNPALSLHGANVSVEAGIAAGAPQISTFITKYIDSGTQFDSELVSYVEGVQGITNLSAAQAKQTFDAMSPALQRVFVETVFEDLLRFYGEREARSGNGDYSGAFAALETLFPGANPNLAQHQTNPYSGNIELYFSRIYSLQGGNISLLAPGGEVNVGLAQPPVSFGVTKAADQLGLVAQTTGDISSVSYSDFQVNQSRTITANGGNILVWSTEGNIDAGRGSKTALSAPPAIVNIDSQTGDPIVTLRAPLTGSGIQALASARGLTPGNVDLFAPHGVVNANDAGIVAGNLTVAATAVLGSNNISVSGTEVGVPVAVTGLGASVAGASSSAAGAVSSAANSLSDGRSDQSKAPVAEAALSWLDVFVVGFGEEGCKAEDAECLKRQDQKH